ncbi:MAG: helix-turn-helix transcriptional regulator [Candidatus Thermoplasmatota archaeon]|nr:helix-turn-helix transcriptional regulator [Candidatus Thermoplasmatota archaeon]
MELPEDIQGLVELKKNNLPAPNIFTISIGKQIRKARLEKNLSQKDLANSISVRRATISDFENGKSEIGVLMLANLALSLGKPISYFFRGTKLGELVGDLENSEEEELLNVFKILEHLGWGNLALNQVKAIADYFVEIENNQNS